MKLRSLCLPEQSLCHYSSPYHSWWYEIFSAWISLMIFDRVYFIDSIDIKSISLGIYMVVRRCSVIAVQCTFTYDTEMLSFSPFSLLFPFTDDNVIFKWIYCISYSLLDGLSISARLDDIIYYRYYTWWWLFDVFPDDLAISFQEGSVGD